MDLGKVLILTLVPAPNKSCAAAYPHICPLSKSVTRIAASPTGPNDPGVSSTTGASGSITLGIEGAGAGAGAGAGGGVAADTGVGVGAEGGGMLLAIFALHELVPLPPLAGPLRISALIRGT